MKVYSRTGDKGKTSLFSGERLLKNTPRVEAYGTIDELNSFCGAIIAVLPDCHERMRMDEEIKAIQMDLFNVGALLATKPGSANIDLLQGISQERIDWLERRIDDMEEVLDPLTSFILPGGHPSSAWSQVTRTVCRRAERGVVSIAENEDGEGLQRVLSYLNRLSDYFFVLARFCNKSAGVEESIWHG